MNILDFGKIVGEKGRESPGPIYHPTNMDINKSILKDKDLTSVLVVCFTGYHYFYQYAD
jgi:hypothetical protein